MHGESLESSWIFSLPNPSCFFFTFPCGFGFSHLRPAQQEVLGKQPEGSGSISSIRPPNRSKPNHNPEPCGRVGWYWARNNPGFDNVIYQAFTTSRWLYWRKIEKSRSQIRPQNQTQLTPNQVPFILDDKSIVFFKICVFFVIFYFSFLV